ncbi:LysR family transcriptional regulator [Mediterraneibacter glycyrrhizinilyticus]|uniref:LysR family transcriptional regulator n=1 Tax=Mediterraneibacter glycyrrhizinilyticus TaxID=342942 RepID=UPI001FAF14DE|nr:LysR family transcriptional regulator [Mediterraneibacter glycyrrhizinilyticus]MDM8126147.1 LysR family transcriptional regulator [Mediterraneibacter glycyrrhizinilyticus]
MRILVSVFQKNSITKAAQELHLAQPSVSLAVRELEEYYGIRLFDRIGRHIAPTECGKEFYEYAVHIVSLFNEMEQKMRNWDTFGTLRVGASITIGTHILPVLIHGYQEKFPDLTIEAKVSRSASIEDELIHSGIDLGLIETQPSHPDLRAVPFMTDSMCVIIPPGHPLSSAKSISLAGLSRFPFLMREKGSAGRELLDAAFSLQQITVSPRWESTSTQALVKAVAEGLGVSVLPYLLVKKDIEEGTVRQVPLDQPIRRNLNVIYHKSKFLTDNMRSFIDLCKKYGKSVK